MNKRLKKFLKVAICITLAVIALSVASCNIVLNNQNNLQNQSSTDSSFINAVYSDKIIEANFTVYLNSYVLNNKNKKIKEETSQGSGVLFNKIKGEDENSNLYTYYLLTNNHVVYKKTKEFNNFDYSVRDCYGTTYDAKVLVADKNYDLAIVTFNSTINYKVLTLADSNPEKSDIVMSIGQPLGIINAVTIGKVEKYMKVDIPDDGDINKDIINVEFSVIKHNCLLNHGSSGGVLINTEHQIIGINFAADVQENSEYVSGYAIPVDKVKEFIENNNEILK